MARRKKIKQKGKFSVWSDATVNPIPKRKIPFSKSPTGPPPGVMREYKARAKGIGINLDDPVNKHLFGTPGQRLKLEQWSSFLDAQVPPRVLVLRNLERYWSGEQRFHGIEEFHAVVLKDTEDVQLSLHFSGQTAFLIKVEGNRALKSTEFTGSDARTRALQRLKENRVTWIERFESLHVTTPEQAIPSPLP